MLDSVCASSLVAGSPSVGEGGKEAVIDDEVARVYVCELLCVC